MVRRLAPFAGWLALARVAPGQCERAVAPMYTQTPSVDATGGTWYLK